MVRKSLVLLIVCLVVSMFVIGCEKSEPEVQEANTPPAQAPAN